MNNSDQYQKDGTFLSNIITNDKYGDAEFVRIVSILTYKKNIFSSNHDNQWPKSLSFGVFLSSPSEVCLCQLPSWAEWSEEHPLFTKFKHKKKLVYLLEVDSMISLRKVKRLLVATVNRKQDVSADFFQFVTLVQRKLFPNSVVEWLYGDILKKMLLSMPPLGVRYYPGDSVDGEQLCQQWEQKALKEYNLEFDKLYGKINFVGMSVYKEEATTSVEMESIYIPLDLLPEGMANDQSERVNPLTLLEPGSRHVVLGDPGSGKSTLLRFLAISGRSSRLRNRYNVKSDDRLPVLVTLRQYADELRRDPQLGLVDYLVKAAESFLGITVDRLFFEYFLYGGKALLLFDGIDELPDIELKQIVRLQVGELLNIYPGNTVIVSSRIVGYEKKARFDSLGFSHFQVAALTSEQMQKFIHDWYGAKIENKNNRDSHANDLCRIVYDAENNAIYDLACNPLLLTIICLVHRIDAVLPDERVVLYSKCSETLLNTWHAWKFQKDQGQGRGKIERRNRSRIETIAFWMHDAMEGQDATNRAVMPYNDLLDFLENYIKEIEHPKDHNPRLLAEEFICFVKERAGLLIEVGDLQFSFVHLTFQEYLAATHLRKSGEEGGVTAIWKIIKDRCDDDRWHEVVRLLIGALEQTKSQTFMLEQILGDNKANAVSQALLAGGCLLDSVEAAEWMEEQIIHALLFAAAKEVDSVDGLRKLLRQLAAWQKRDTDNQQRLSQWVLEIVKTDEGRAICDALALNLVSLGWSEEEVCNATGFSGNLNTKNTRIYQACIHSDLSLTDEERKKLFDLKYISISHSLGGNMLGVILSGLCPVEAKNSINPGFLNILLSFICNKFDAQIYNVLRVGNFRGVSDSFKDRERNISFSSLDLDQNLKMFKFAGRIGRTHTYRSRLHNLEKLRASVRDFLTDRSLDLSFDRLLDRSLDQFHGRFRFLDPFRNHFYDLHENLDKIKPSEMLHKLKPVQFWKTFIAQEKNYGPVLDVFCDLFDLSPRIQWREALRLRALPQVPDRITLLDYKLWQNTVETFKNGTPNDVDHWNAAAFIILDIFFFSVFHDDEPEKIFFKTLVDSTRDEEHPALKFSHCLRDIMQGDNPRVKNLDDLFRAVYVANEKLYHSGSLIVKSTDKKSRGKYLND